MQVSVVVSAAVAGRKKCCVTSIDCLENDMLSTTFFFANNAVVL